ncbi:hypothetical protein G7Y89_g6417 [Cudoniella acicularis]|uniref:Uncharacterized protein n=1 Tax=Cudoniella acicularis TaxID=354080 RepID=A0A8H4W310_9HELO|nr:hypothetical protein G7Y89_g6417 [Cudoniella acicularis]
MYSIVQPLPNVNNSTPQFQTREPAPMQILSDVVTPYVPASALGPPGLQHYGYPGSSNAYQQQQSPPARAPLIQGYEGGIAMGGIPQQAPEIMEEEDFQAQGHGMEAAYITYQTPLKEIFQIP